MDAGRRQVILDGPLEHPPNALHLRVDARAAERRLRAVLRMKIAGDHQLADSFQGGWAKHRNKHLTVEMVERAQRIPHGLHFAGRRAIDTTVILFDVLPVTRDQLSKRQVGRRFKLRQAPASGFPIENHPLVLLPAGGGIVLAQEEVLALAGDAIGEGDDGLSGLAMKTIRRDARLSGHGGFLPCAEGSALFGIFRPRCPTQTGTLKMRSAKGLGQVHLAGLEPATFGSVDRCSIQLSYRCAGNRLAQDTWSSPP